MTTIYEKIVEKLIAIQVGGSARFTIYHSTFDESIARKVPSIFVYPSSYGERPEGTLAVTTHKVYVAELFNRAHSGNIDDVTADFELDLDRISSAIHANRTMDKTCIETKVLTGRSTVTKSGKGEVHLRCPIQIECLGIRS